MGNSGLQNRGPTYHFYEDLDSEILLQRIFMVDKEVFFVNSI